MIYNKEHPCRFEGTYTTDFTVHKTGAVSIGNVRHGASTIIATCLREIARDQNLSGEAHVDIDTPLHYANKAREDVIGEARDKLLDGYAITDAVAFVKDKHGLNKILAEDIEDELRKKGVF